ncbi:MAG TPA: ATP synthase F1 subunit delta [Tepidisphaeraceae bacterium]|jgi:F-type H+-transporting ATPase subunit delta
MATFDQDQATSSSYARALLELADERGQTQQVSEDLATITQLLADNDAFRQYLADPTIGKKGRDEMISRIFGGQIAPILSSFFQLLNARHQLANFPAIAQAFKKLINARSGNVDVEVMVPQLLSESELEDIRHQINTRLHKNSILTQKVDESLIGGLILKIGDSLIDGSVKTQLETLRRRMIAAT